MLAGENDHEAVERTGEGRAINRHDYSETEIAQALERPVVQGVLELVRLRREHAAFDGRLEVTVDDTSRLRLTWTSGAHLAELRADVASAEMEFVI